MFCKWCGVELPDFATKCDSCGKDVPAKSECGGFYNLVPAARDLTPKEEPRQQTAAVNQASSGQRPQRRPQPRRRMFLLSGVAFLGVLILLVILVGKLNKSISLLEQVSEHMGIAPGTVEQQEQSPLGNSEVSAPTHPVVVPLSQQDILVKLGVENTGTGPAVQTSVDMSRFDDVADIHVSYDENNCLTGALIDLGQANSCITLKTENAPGVIRVDIVVDETVLGTLGEEEKPLYEWSYRTDAEAEWQPLDAELFAISDDEAKVTYTAEALAGLMEGKEAAEFRLTYRRTNIKGGSLTIVISGITVAGETLEEALSENTEEA